MIASLILISGRVTEILLNHYPLAIYLVSVLLQDGIRNNKTVPKVLMIPGVVPHFFDRDALFKNSSVKVYMCEVSPWNLKKWTSERWDSFWIFWEVVHVQVPRLYLIFGGCVLHLQESRLVLFTKSEMTSFCVGKPLLFKSTGCFGYKTVVCGDEINLVDSIKCSIALKNTPRQRPDLWEAGIYQIICVFTGTLQKLTFNKSEIQSKKRIMYVYISIYIFFETQQLSQKISRKNVYIYIYTIGSTNPKI